jgi:hypothetical protein
MGEMGWGEGGRIDLTDITYCSAKAQLPKGSPPEHLSPEFPDCIKHSLPEHQRQVCQHEVCSPHRIALVTVARTREE